MDLCKKIGYSPKNPQLSEEDSHALDVDPIVHQQTGGTFTPAKVSPNTEKFTGVSIKQFPKEVDSGEVIEFIIKAGLSQSKADNITLNEKGTAVIRGLDNPECLDLIAAIHGTRHFGRKLYCNGIVALTPEKIDDLETTKASSSSYAAETFFSSDAAPAPTTPVEETQTDLTKNFVPQIDIGSSNLEKFDSSFLSAPQLVRRHSLSILDRSPPPNSLAAQLLASSNLTRISSKTILSDIANIRDSISDFNSCIESVEESSQSSEGEKTEGEKKGIENPISLNEKKRLKKKKRKLVQTPEKEEFLKRPNNQTSPQ